jgi:galactokinase
VVAGDVPIGAGLSSSAEQELATARGFAALGGSEWDPARMALLCQKAENDWVGVQCGIMDQMISAVGREGHAVLIDCRSLETQPVPMPRGTTVVIMDTATRRGLVDSAYNERRRQCEEAARFFGVPALRDVTPGIFASRAHRLDPLTARRARHVVSENERTLAAADAMRSGDAARLGELMNRSHGSLRADFEVSCPSLDAMVEIAQAHPGCLGARMTGAGFGGCAVALVRDGEAEAFIREVEREYRAATGLEPQLHLSRASGGASLEPAGRPVRASAAPDSHGDPA